MSVLRKRIDTLERLAQAKGMLSIERLKAYQADEMIEEVIARSPQVSMAQRDTILTAI